MSGTGGEYLNKAKAARQSCPSCVIEAELGTRWPYEGPWANVTLR